MMITDYELASVHLGKKTDRPLPGRATRLIRRDDHSIAVRYQSTDVVTYRDDLTAVLNTGGWLTSTTKERMKEYANARLFTDRGTWYIGGDWSTPKHLRPIYVDGMIVDARGVPLTLQYATPTDTERKRRLDKLVSTYIKGFSAYIIEHGIDNPSNGDCWGCLMQVQGKTETDHKGWYRHRETPHGRVEPMGMDHYISHFEEKYFVPSLLLNAIVSRGYGSPAFIWQMIQARKDGPFAARILRSYFKDLKPALLSELR